MPEAASSHQPSAGAGARKHEMMQSPMIPPSVKDSRVQSMQMSQEFNN